MAGSPHVAEAAPQAGLVEPSAPAVAAQHTGPTSREILLQLEGLDDMDLQAGYIPSYFRRQPMPAHDEETSTLTLSMVLSILRDLNVHGSYGGPNFVDVVTPQLATLQGLASILGEDHLRYSVSFSPFPPQEHCRRPSMA
eukprot:GGOE01000707.1.p2 GENE.GGOE01000707.1~~GGOE01000707.1.p2  ORF type:complete len:140 (-),score=46.82 GGOE01000707.1:357-776(-)